MAWMNRLLALTLVAWLGTGSIAYAYIDPGSGALMWQMLLAGFFGFLFYARRVFNWVRGWLGDRKKRAQDDSARR